MALQSVHFPEEQVEEKVPPPPEGESVYDNILPASIAYKPSPSLDPVTTIPSPEPPPGYALMPLVAFLRDNSTREFGWHRKAERRARGLFPLSSLKTQLESWERQLVSRV